MDEMLQTIKMMPMYMLGDMTVNPWISADTPTYANKNNAAVTLNSGTSDYTQTAQYVNVGGCTNCGYTQVPCQVWQSVIEATPSFCNPWTTDVMLKGTSGMQFSPLLVDQSTLAVTTDQV
jgi:hypothetical protein